MTVEKAAKKMKSVIGEILMAEQDCQTHGVGYMRVFPNGELERLDPATVFVIDEPD